MPRQCSICAHEQREAIDRALLAGEALRDIAGRYGVSKSSAERHKAEHLPERMTQAKAAAETAQADDLLTELRALRSKAYSLLLAAEKQGDLRTALSGVREARATLELLAELEDRLDRRQHLTVVMAPDWPAVVLAITSALAAYPEARASAAQALLSLEAGRVHRA